MRKFVAKLLVLTAGLLALAGGAPAVRAAACLVHRTHSTAGERVISPYGVDRTGRASAGWHQGLDIVNSAGRGDPILSGTAGHVSYAHQAHGAGEYITVNAGDMKWIYMHMQQARQDLAGKNVQPGEQIGQMGCTGMGECRPHLHLGALLRGDALKAAGAGGRVWREGSGKSLGNSPLTADAIKSAMPSTWYLVNPEPYLDHQIPMDGSDGAAAVYGPQLGGWRSSTLPRTCSPDQTVTENPRLASTTGTGAASAAVDSLASNAGGNEGAAATAAGQDRHGLMVDFAKLVAADLAATTAQQDLDARGAADSALAHMLLVEVER
ncbi:M23 family metallopeptidase [Xanthobacter sediminis]|uniref:M23 family metallopeptidase n=1 Tax=Xanthobacter sediminis TaxID=3119926 RepID=UPI003728EF7A